MAGFIYRSALQTTQLKIKIMKKIQSIIMGLCWLFVAVSSVRLLIHIFTNDLETIGQALGLSPFVLFIFALLYLSGGLLWAETKQAFK